MKGEKKTEKIKKKQREKCTQKPHLVQHILNEIVVVSIHTGTMEQCIVSCTRWEKNTRTKSLRRANKESHLTPINYGKQHHNMGIGF